MKFCRSVGRNNKKGKVTKRSLRHTRQSIEQCAAGSDAKGHPLALLHTHPQSHKGRRTFVGDRMKEKLTVYHQIVHYRGVSRAGTHHNVANIVRQQGSREQIHIVM